MWSSEQRVYAPALRSARLSSGPPLLRCAGSAFLRLLLLLALSACAPSDKSGKFSVALGRVLRSDRPAQIDLAKIDGPVWDEMFIFAPKSLRDDNCKILALSWLECRTTLPTAVADGENFIVFRTKGRISSAQRHAQSNGEFVLPDSQNYELAQRNAAVFTVEPIAAANSQDNPLFRLRRAR